MEGVDGHASAPHCSSTSNSSMQQHLDAQSLDAVDLDAPAHLMDYQGHSDSTNLLLYSKNVKYSHQELENGESEHPREVKLKRLKGKNFSIDEDMLLISAWLNTSIDRAEGTNRSSNTFWDRIHEYFHRKKEFDTNRTKNSLMHRWSTIQIAVNKFCGFYAQIERSRPSGTNEHGKINLAKELYQKETNNSFQFKHCWLELRLQPKWMSMVSGSNKKQKNRRTVIPETSPPTTPDSINLGNDMSPPLVKSSKHALKIMDGKLKGSIESSSPVMAFLEKMNEENGEQTRKKLELLEKICMHDSERILNERKRLQLKEEKAEERIMALDTSTMDQLSAEYYNQRKMEILQKRMHQ